MTQPAEGQHGPRLRALAREIAEALPGDWRVSVPADIQDVARLTRSDGLALSMYWHWREQRATIRPRQPEIPGSSREHTGIAASFDPTRPAARIASDVQRRVVVEWEPKLAELNERHAKTLDARSQAAARLRSLAQVLHTDSAELERQLRNVEQGGEAALSVGRFNHMSLDGSIEVSTYRQRATFKIDVHDHRTAMVLARVLAAELARTPRAAA